MSIALSADASSERAMSSPTAYDPETIARGAEALLREHPDALVAALASNGLIVPVPQSVSLWGQELIEGRAVFDKVVAADRNTVARMWVNLTAEGATTGKVRLLEHPSSWMTLHFLDVRATHDIVLAVLLPSEEPGDEQQESEHASAPAAPRFCTLVEDEGARVIDCDDAFTQMLGYTLEEMYGKSVLDQIHPDDQGRAVEGWLALLATRRAQQTRCRRRRKDGSWIWVDTTLHNYLNEPGRNHVLVEIIDASAEMHAQEVLAEREELLRRLTDAMPVGLLQLDTAGEVVYSNERLLDILFGSAAAAPKPDEDAPLHASKLLAPLTEEGTKSFDGALAEVMADGAGREVEADVAIPGGELRRMLMTLRALQRPSGEVYGAITCVLDITDSARARSELEIRATYDPLTGCHNRSSILSALEHELADEQSAGTGVIYVDLDKFKPVNDTLGHAAGDELLVLVAERLRLASRDRDLVGRLGGDEFLIVLHDIPTPEVAMKVAERICGSLEREFELGGGSAQLGGSAGVACSHGGVTDFEELVRMADAAMYESKEQRAGCPQLAPGSRGA
jgi:diguanylate cyclase (GGDEF)-like protein/PAS domain S-box-containing protein